MARARGGGATGYAWALVFFGAGFIICLLLAIIFYTQVSGARAERESAVDELEQVITANERSNAVVQPLFNQPGTVVGQLLTRSEELQAQVNQLQNDVSRLEAERDAASKARQRAEAEQESLRQQTEQAMEQANKVKTEFAQATAELNSRVEQQARQAAQMAERIKQMEGSWTEQMAQAREELRGQVNEARTQVTQIQTENANLLRQIREQRTRAERLPGRTEPDGRILAVLEGDNRVYINLGRGDRLAPGMTFEVFDSGQLIKVNDYDELRGVATIEVVSIGDASSVARIVRSERGRSVSEGDVIANLVYAPQATPRFYIFGDFNIDGQGSPSEADRERVENMISRWGGEVAESLTPDVDYLVLGEQPRLPDQLPPNETDPARIARFVEQTQQYETYQSLVGEARSLGIPVLNQNRFLSLVGYYER